MNLILPLAMQVSPLRYLFCTPHNVKFSIRSIVNASSQLNTKHFHIYSKTYSKRELIQYIKDNIVYETDDYVAASVPQGISLKKTSRWLDMGDFFSGDSDLNEIAKELPEILKAESVFVTHYPKRNASGLVIFSKNYETHNTFRQRILASKFNKEYNFNYLAVVLGRPKQSLCQTFGIMPYKVGDQYGTEILQEWKDSKKIEKTMYHHEVLCSMEHVSLVKIETSNDSRDCARHILATCCSTPVLGDSYNYVKMNSNFLGVPVSVDPSIAKENKSLELDGELLTKLELKRGSEKVIPPLIHVQSIKLTLKKNVKFFLNVPPPENFVWTCRQLGLHEIDHFEKIK